MRNTVFLLTALLYFTISASAASNEWKEHFNNGTVQILYRYTDCHDNVNDMHKQKVIFRFVNTGNKKVQISFAKSMVYDNASPVSDEKIFTVTLLPNQALEGSCDNRDNTFFIFAKHLNFKDKELSSFKLTNISVKTIE